MFFISKIQKKKKIVFSLYSQNKFLKKEKKKKKKTITKHNLFLKKKRDLINITCPLKFISHSWQL